MTFIGRPATLDLHRSTWCDTHVGFAKVKPLQDQSYVGSPSGAEAANPEPTTSSLSTRALFSYHHHRRPSCALVLLRSSLSKSNCALGAYQKQDFTIPASADEPGLRASLLHPFLPLPPSPTVFRACLTEPVCPPSQSNKCFYCLCLCAGCTAQADIHCSVRFAPRNLEGSYWTIRVSQVKLPAGQHCMCHYRVGLDLAPI